MPAILIKHLYKTYRGCGKPAVADLSLSIEKGEFFGLLGANGAGKTSTLSILCGLRGYTDGVVEVNGMDVARQIHRIRPLIGVVPQEYALYPELTALENLKVFGGVYGLPEKVLAERIRSLCQTLGVGDLLQQRIQHLSGGQKRRFNLIAGLLHQPQILFLDEPTVGIDVKSQQVITDYLKVLHGQGTTIVYTSHLMQEAESLCTRVAVMNQGSIVALGSPQELVLRHGCASLHDVCLKLIS